MILAESAVWMFPLSLIASFALQKFKHLPPARFLLATLLIWAVIGTTIICVYKIFWFPPGVPAVTRDFAQLAYGWIIPCAIIWLALTILSLRFRVEAKSGTGR